jgi:hypothetical protein
MTNKLTDIIKQTAAATGLAAVLAGSAIGCASVAVQSNEKQGLKPTAEQTYVDKHIREYGSKAPMKFPWYVINNRVERALNKSAFRQEHTMKMAEYSNCDLEFVSEIANHVIICLRAAEVYNWSKEKKEYCDEQFVTRYEIEEFDNHCREKEVKEYHAKK